MMDVNLLAHVEGIELIKIKQSLYKMAFKRLSTIATEAQCLKQMVRVVIFV
ncbi:hypothetical protein [Alkaliphilus serpentinus]|uniref:hypothetical protein n=1 Tax=Alkaliphilus serpentinus TaxID=1482731 RepID=UPI001865890C|nr:hypothetical protein [Alkaliphilus serpentinus]